MYDEEREHRRLYVASDTEDVPTISSGSLIPRYTIYSAPQSPHTAYERTVWYMRPAVLIAFSIFLFATSIGTSVYSLFSGTSSVAAPIMATEIEAPEQFNFGYQVEPTSSESVANTIASLVAASSTFVEIDIPHKKVRVYDNGETTDTFPILQTPHPDSWWYVPVGVYEVTELNEERYSEFANIYQPWSINFGKNYYLNAVPYYQDKSSVPVGYKGGGIRLGIDDAKTLYELVEVGTAIVVRGVLPSEDAFVFQRKVSGLSAKQYLIADLQNSTVLAASDLDGVVPIASLTKLMTALVATEEIDLDQDVRIRGGTSSFVSSLIPRLRVGHSASMYSLLQLLLIESSNEAAEVIASVIGREKFIARMNERASEIGMEHTTFTDPSGLDDGNRSTVGDLFRLTKYISTHRGFILELTADQHLPTAYTDGEFGELVNFNTIDDVEFIAGKIGETLAAGQTSISLHRLMIDGSERTMVVIILGSERRSADVKRLVELVYERFDE